MSEGEKRQCDPNDLICKLEVLRHLEGLNQQLGNESFQELFPEARPLADRIQANLTHQEQVVQESLEACMDEDDEEEFTHVIPAQVTSSEDQGYNEED